MSPITVANGIGIHNHMHCSVYVLSLVLFWPLMCVCHFIVGISYILLGRYYCPFLLKNTCFLTAIIHFSCCLMPIWMMWYIYSGIYRVIGHPTWIYPKNGLQLTVCIQHLTTLALYSWWVNLHKNISLCWYVVIEYAICTACCLLSYTCNCQCIQHRYSVSGWLSNQRDPSHSLIYHTANPTCGSCEASSTIISMP